MSEKISIDPNQINTIASALTTKKVPLTTLQQRFADTIPPQELTDTLNALIHSGIVSVDEQDQIRLTRKLPTGITPCQYYSQRQSTSDLLLLNNQQLPPTPASDWHESHLAARQASQNKVITETVSAKAPHSRHVLYLTELNFGYRWSDHSVLRDTITHYQNLPEHLRPKACIVGGLVYGEYRYQRKPLQDNVIFSLSDQFRQAHQFLTDLSTLGAQIIINASDKEIGRYSSVATQLAADIYYHIKKNAQTHPAITSSAPTNESSFDTLYKDPLFSELRAAARYMYLPYCLATGRTLYDTNQMITYHDYAHPEGVALLQAYRALKQNQPIPIQVQQLLATNAIPDLNGLSPQGWHYLDDHQLEFVASKARLFSINTKKRAGNVSDVLLRTDTMGGLRAASRVTEEPDTLRFTTETGQHQLLISQEGFQDFILTTPGQTDAAPLRTAQGTYANGADLAYRMQYMRKRNGVPGTIALKQNKDQSLEFQVTTRNLLEKRNDQQAVVIEWNDWQWESDTHRPDLAAKFIARTQDVLLEAAKNNQDVVLIVNGDIKQGVNFRGKQHAEPASRSGIDVQDNFLLEFLQTSFAHFGFNQDLTEKKFTKALKQLKKVIILPGNHCWNSGFRDYGSVHMRSLVNFFEKLYLSAGIRPEDHIIAPDRVYSNHGDFYYWWMYNGQISGYQIMAQHDILDKGGSSGSKGANNGPIMQVATQHEGLRDDMDIDFDLRGHWHRFQMATFPRSRYPKSGTPFTDGVVSIIAPAIAGGSTYEHRRGLHSYIGQIELHLGGGYLPVVRLNTHQTLANYHIKHGYFADENLHRIGFDTDPQFDPLASGFYGSEGRQSALQKAIHHMRNSTVGTGTLSRTATLLGRH